MDDLVLLYARSSRWMVLIPSVLNREHAMQHHTALIVFIVESLVDIYSQI